VAARALAPVPGEPGRDKGERTRQRHAGTIAAVSSPYDSIAELYDPWSASVVEDVSFYLEEARRSGGAVLELGVGTGRIAVPIAAEGIRVIGVDSSRGMLEVCARRAALAGVEVDLRVGDLREPPVSERVPLVICPFRSLLHMHTDKDRRSVLTAVRELLLPGGRFVFDVFTPGAEDIAQTHERWLEREPGIFERAVWDEVARTLTLTVRGPDGETTMALAWLSADEWRALLEGSGFDVEECYGWFDRTPFTGGDDSVWIARTTPASPPSRR
jgi:SAM-dependent methyltransferase